MPYGHIRQYKELVAEAQKKRIQITRQQQQQIAKLYRDIAYDMGKDISRKSEKTLTYRWLKDYAKSLKGQSRQIYNDLQGIVSLGILETAAAVSDAEQEFWGGVVPGLSERFRDTFSTIPQTCVDELMSGGIYKDFAGLSERLWNYKQKFDRDIGYIIDRGIIEQKSAYNLAKDLEMYVDPRAAKPWEWRKVYPNCNRVVDYNAQRLARTSVTHAYQMSFQRSTVDNPFVEAYQWHSSNAGRTCELCRQRNGQLFEKNSVPLDHPNGMCIITAVIPKSIDEIADELSNWAAGGSNPALDRWLGNGLETKKENVILDKKDTKEGIQVYSVGTINRDIYKCITEDIVTDEVIITDERIQHIKERHPNDYERFYSYIPEIINDPDFIIEANKPNTAVVLKEIEERGEKFKLILRIKVQGDPEEYKNSIMTFWRIGETTWRKTLKNKTALYKKE